jgi:Relaxase/Mobilisation nuclease domain
MIAKGNQRSGGQNLATHLMNAFDNERVEIADMRGAIAQDLHGAFAQWHAHSKATRCREYLYSLSINPDDRQGNLTREQYLDFIRRVEKKLGLSEQARAVVFHTKEGRLHCHAVWSRIDLEKLKAVQLSNDRQKLRSVVQEFARDHGLELPDGLKQDRGKERFEDQKRDVSLAEKQQQERTGETKAERMAAIGEAWRSSDNGTAFVQALKDRGYHIARGDKRAYVVVDRYGEIHSLPRQIEGIKTKDLDARLKDYPLAGLPAVEAVQETVRKEREQADRAREERAREQVRETVVELEVPVPADRPTAENRRGKLEEKQAARRAGIEQRRQALALTHITEREALADIQAAENTGIVSDRMKRQP